MSTNATKPCNSRGATSQRRQQSKIMAPPVPLDPLITSTSLSKPNDDTRKLIRSHVMRGKNKRIPKIYISELGTTQNMQLSRDSHENIHAHLPGAQTVLSGSGFSGVRFAVETTPYTRNLLCTFFTLSKVSPYPIDALIVLDRMDRRVFQCLQFDVLYFNSLVYSTQVYLDRIIREHSPSSPPSCRNEMRHGIKTMTLLRERLAEPGKVATGDTTVSVVVSFVTIAAVMGDREVAAMQMEGLARIVGLRGGLGTLRGAPQTLIKVYRADVYVALLNRTRPFFALSIPVNNALPYLPTPDLEQSLFSPAAAFDSRISLIWNTLHDFCTTANDNHSTVTLEHFEQTVIASIYASLHLAFDAEQENVSEIMRLALLPFASTVFLLGTNIEFPALVRDLQNVLLLAEGHGLGGFGRCRYEVRLWVLWIAGMGAAMAEGSVLDDDVVWMLRRVLWEGGLSYC